MTDDELRALVASPAQVSAEKKQALTEARPARPECQQLSDLFVQSGLKELQGKEVSQDSPEVKAVAEFLITHRATVNTHTGLNPSSQSSIIQMIGDFAKRFNLKFKRTRHPILNGQRVRVYKLVGVASEIE